jgi:hypothetical protein
MGSPFSFASNATLTFSVPSSKYVLDEYENLIPELIPLTITCLLKPSPSKPDIDGGIDQSETTFEGFLVDPLELPIEIKPYTKAIARITVANGVVETGEFTLLKVIQNPFVMSANVNLVNKIRGIFRAVN